MMVSTRYNKGAGNTAVAARLRNQIGEFWNFNLLVWVAVEVADCWTFLAEVPDSDEFESLYVADVTIPAGGPWLIEAIVTSTGLCLGGEPTPGEAPDNATLQGLRADITTARATKLDNLDAIISSRLAAVDYSAPPSPASIAVAVWSAAERTLTGFGTLVADVWGFAVRTITGGGGSGGVSLAEIEASAVLAKEATLTAIQETQADLATGLNQVLTDAEKLLDIGQGKWEIANNQMVFYTRAGAELMRFNLQDANGNPSMTEVFKRIPG